MSRVAVREHEVVKGLCLHCGGREPGAEMTCVSRFIDAPPRPKPSSIFDTPWEIGERMNEIMAEEAKVVAGTPEPTTDLADLG